MTLSGSFDVKASADRVSFSFTVGNTGDEAVTLTFRDARTVDFTVFDGEDERWRWSDGRMFAQTLHSTALEPGESVTHEGDWEDPESGEYTAVATLEADGTDCEARTDLSV